MKSSRGPNTAHGRIPVARPPCRRPTIPDHRTDNLAFTCNDAPTFGIEIELQLVDSKTGALRSAIEAVRDELPESMAEQIKPELMQSYLEINTDVCRDVGQARSDLQAKLQQLRGVTDSLGLSLLWAGTHPFSSWRDQEVTRAVKKLKRVDYVKVSRM